MLDEERFDFWLGRERERVRDLTMRVKTGWLSGAPVSYLLPRAFGGRLEDVRDLVLVAINSMAIAGQGIGTARDNYQAGVAAMNEGRAEPRIGFVDAANERGPVLARR